MNDNAEIKLLKQIEVLRRRLNKYAYCKDFTSAKIVSLSQRMDKLLNRYHKVINTGVLSKKAEKVVRESPRMMPYETPYPIIVKMGKEEYILIKLFEEGEIWRNRNIKGSPYAPTKSSGLPY